MSVTRSLSDAIQNISRKAVAQIRLVDCEVKSVNLDDRTCIVSNIEGQRNFEGLVVRLQSETSDGELDIPAIDSTVTVAFTDFGEPVVISKSDLDKKIVIIEEQGFELSKDGFKFNDGSFGGLIKIEELVSKVNRLEDFVNDLLQTLQGVVIPLAPSGTYPLSTDFAATQPISPKTSKSDLENTSITHGEKL